LRRATSPSGIIGRMIWTLIALLLVTHGALRRWLQGGPARPGMATAGDVLLITIGLLTVDQLQGLGALEILRVGVFFVLFGYAGRRLVSTLLAKAPA
jgi:hypothetical protein